MKIDLLETKALTTAIENFKPTFKNVADDHPPKQHQCPSRQPWRQIFSPATVVPEVK